MNTSTKFIASVACLGLLMAVQVSNVLAHQGSHVNFNRGDKIRVIHLDNKENTLYSVNGKEFSKNDLTDEQKQRLEAVEAKLLNAEQKFDEEEFRIDEITDQIEEKARQIELEVEKIEQAFVKVSKQKMNLEDLENAMQELELSARANEIALEAKELELDKLDEKLEVIDLTLVAELEQFSDEYDKVLLQIASELD